MDTINSNQLIEVTLQQGNKHLSDMFKGDVLFLKSAMRQTVDDAVKDEIEEIKRLKKKPQSKIVVFIETTGGYIETVERIVSVLRQHYKTVEYVIPNHAYSAGTVLVMSGDEIHMDYYSILGPIDPQLPIDGTNMPGMGYLAKFEELVKKINNSTDPAKTRAELAYLVNKFDPAMLYTIEQSIQEQ